MPSLHLISHRSNQLNLGETCTFRLEGGFPGLMMRPYLRHMGLFNPKPLHDWSAEQTVTIFPEAPGSYSLLVEWQEPGGSRGWIQADFTVLSNVETVNRPRMLKTSQGFNLWVPSGLEAAMFQNYEQPVFDLLDGLVKPGWVVYDVGANFGYYSLHFGSEVGLKGHVYCFEANPICVYFLQANLQENGLSNYDILPGALLDREGTVNFTINYANSALGIAQPSGFYSSKVGHELGIAGQRLDHLVNWLNLRAPNLIKIDVEGAEEQVLSGMKETLRAYHPYILVELHGRNAALGALGQLGAFNYRFKVVNGPEFAGTDAMMRWFPDAVLQVLCLPY